MAISTSALYATASIVVRQIKWAISSIITVPVTAAILSGLLAWGAGAYLAPGLIRLLSEIGFVLVGYPVILVLLGGKTTLSDLTVLLRGVTQRTVVTA